MQSLRLVILVCVVVAVRPAWGQYELVWSEEFDGTSINASSWIVDQYHGVTRSATDAGFYTDRPENARVADGNLTILAHRESFDLAAYTTARLQTYGKRAFTFGRFSIRMRAPTVPGLRPQISLLPVDLTYGSWPASGEIDLVNVVDGAVMSGIHFGGSGPRGTQVERKYPDSEAAADGYHVYTVEWQPHEIRWSIDDKLAAVQNQWQAAAAAHPSPFDRPFYLAVGLAVESSGAEQLEGWPYKLEIDWIRVHQARGNRSPVVRLTDPGQGAALPTAQRVSIRAQASDPDGNLAGVEFYGNETLLGVDREPPFSFDWSPADGCYSVVARAFDQDGFGRAESAEVTVGRGCPPTPFHETPAPIPGRIEAEDFDRSRKNEAYYDTDAVNHGGAYRPDSAVDIQTCSGGGYNLAWMIDDEWTRYTVAVAADGAYDIRCRVASPNDTARIRLEMDGRDISGSLLVPNTGDWQRFTDIVVRRVRLEAGERVLRMVVEHHGLNLDYVEFVPSGAD